MTTSPFFSLITICLNNLEGVQKTHKSILLQNFQDFEWLVIDGNSNDGTASYVQNTKALWESAPDQGLYDAMNKGIERAKGEYLIFLNAGDQLSGDYTLESLALFIKSQIENTARAPHFIYGDSFEDVNNERYHKPARKFEHFKYGMLTHHQAMIYNRHAVGDLRYNLSYPIAADYNFTLHFLRHKSEENGALYFPVPICIFESGGLSQNCARQGRAEQFKIRKENGLIPAWKSVAIYLSQAGLWTLRALNADFYWRLKSSNNKRRDSAQKKALPAHPKNQA